MPFDEAIMGKVLAEFSPNFAPLAMEFFNRYEKVNGIWILKTDPGIMMDDGPANRSN
jgi:hypothetical protein